MRCTFDYGIATEFRNLCMIRKMSIDKTIKLEIFLPIEFKPEDKKNENRHQQCRRFYARNMDDNFAVHILENYCDFPPRNISINIMWFKTIKFVWNVIFREHITIMTINKCFFVSCNFMFDSIDRAIKTNMEINGCVCIERWITSRSHRFWQTLLLARWLATYIYWIETGWFSSSNLSTSSWAHESRVWRYSLIRKNRKLHNFFCRFHFYLRLFADITHSIHTVAQAWASKKRKTIYCSHFIHPFYWSLGWSFVFLYNMLSIYNCSVTSLNTIFVLFRSFSSVSCFVAKGRQLSWHSCVGESVEP